MVHQLTNLSDLAKLLPAEMHPPIHHIEDFLEVAKVLELCRAKWMCLEERDDDVSQVTVPIHREVKEILPMVVVSPVPIDPAAFEEALEQLQRMETSCSLDNRRSGVGVANRASVSGSCGWGTKAPLSVDEADDPLLDTWPFLLIFRT